MDFMDPKERLKQLFDQGGSVVVNHNVPVQRYFRSGQEMMRMANVYYEEKQYESAYLLFAKFITLFLEKIKAHPQYKQAPPVGRAANKQSLKVALDKAEKIKAVLREKYEIEYIKLKSEKKRLEELEAKKRAQEKLEKNERLKLAEETALKEEQIQLDYFVEKQRRKQLEDERRAIEARFSAATTLKDTDNEAPLIPVDFAPPPPTTTDYIPPEPSSAVTHIPKGIGIGTKTIPAVDRSLKPRQTPSEPLPPPSANSISSAYYGGTVTSTTSSNKYGLRTVVSPRELPDKFMQYAKSNTSRNIETCGVLFGNLSKNEFVITHVLIPHQHGNADSCNTTKEEDMWEFQDEYDGICLGWIHTHPSQTAFLSSVDLHTHYPYQCLMSESVAIVCSGKFNETGYFMITPGQGMQDIGKCSKPGHHPHQNHPPLFESCSHVKVSDMHSATFVDWRNR